MSNVFNLKNTLNIVESLKYPKVRKNPILTQPEKSRSVSKYVIKPIFLVL